MQLYVVCMRMYGIEVDSCFGWRSGSGESTMNDDGDGDDNRSTAANDGDFNIQSTDWWHRRWIR
jgi:hypothetical protein